MNGMRMRILALMLCMFLLLPAGRAAFAEELAAPEPERHTVTYLVQEPFSGEWMIYLSEPVRHGYLAKAAVSGAMNPAGLDTEVFIGWHGDAEGAKGPINLLRTPIVADTSLYAKFGDPADVPHFEGIALEITLIPTLSGGQGTFTAEISGVPEGVCYDLQWQSNQSGAFADIPGETGPSITLPLAEMDAGCQWRIHVAF